jgi:hypothetical protein
VLIDQLIERTPPTSEGFENVLATATEASGWVAPQPAAKIAEALCAAKPVRGAVVVVDEVAARVAGWELVALEQLVSASERAVTAMRASNARRRGDEAMRPRGEVTDHDGIGVHDGGQ